MNLQRCVPAPYRSRITILTVLVCLLIAGPVSAESDLKVVLPERGHPYLACTTRELGRLRQAYRGHGPEHDIVAARVKEAERFLDEPVVFPPRGGQHNQWYQCDKCEIALKTIDATHHQCPRCQSVYSGPPYDDVIFAHQHGRNLRRMVTAAWAYAISQDKRFAGYASKILLGYARRYEQYPYHSASLDARSRSGGHLFEQTLNEASCLATDIGPAYDLIHDSEALSAADHQTIRDGLLLPMLRNIGKNKAGKSNWQTWHNAAMLWGGALVRDPAWIQQAITNPRNGFHYQMDASVSKEGMWYENSWGYHFYTLQALVNMAETARRLGLNLWSDERLTRMFTLPVHYTMADGMLPRFGDDVNSSVRRVGRLFEPAYHARKDPQILPLLPERPSFESILLGRPVHATAEPPALKSMVFEDAGHAILRAPGEAGLTAAMTFGPYGGFHGHYDKLSFVFFGFAQELGVDPGRARSQAYRLPVHRNWYKATISHNAVLVDGKSQKPAAGRLRLFEPQDDYVVAVASCDGAYEGVEHTRWLVMTGTYLFVCDKLHSATEHRFDWLYHSRGKRVICDLARDSVNPADDYPGGQYIQNAKRGTTSEAIRMRFEDTKAITYLTMAAGENTRVTIGDGVGASVTDRVPMTMIGREGRDVCFAAVLEPVPTAGKPQVTGVRLAQAEETSVVTVEIGGRTDQISIFPAGKVSVVLGK